MKGLRSFHAIPLLLVAPALCNPDPRSAILENRGVEPLVSRDLALVQTLSFSKYNEDLLDTALQGPNNVEVFCVECAASTTLDVNIDTPEFDLIDLGANDPGDLALTIKFAETSAHLNLEISATGEAVFAIPLFTLLSPIGLEDPTGLLSIGVIPSLDLVFNISGGIDVAGGIDLTIPNDSFIRFDLNGDILDQNFKGTIMTSIPWKATSGNVTFKAGLRLSVQAGVDIGFPIDLGAIVGVDANLIEVIVEFASNPSASCTLGLTESFNVNAGAYIELDVDIGPGDDTISLEPTASTTFFHGPTLTQCLDSSAATPKTKSGSMTKSAIALSAQSSSTLTSPCSQSGGASTKPQRTQRSSFVTSTRPCRPCSNSTTSLPASASTTTAPSNIASMTKSCIKTTWTTTVAV